MWLPRKVMLSPVPERVEQKGYTCSLAALSTVLKYAGVKTSFEEVVAAARKWSPSDGGFASDCSNHVCTSLKRIEDIARSYEDQGIQVNAGEGWTIDEIRAQLYYGKRPVMVNHGGAQPGQIGHSTVIVGVDLSAETVQYIDPLPAGSSGVRSRSLDNFKTVWAKSDAGDPLKPIGYYNWALVVSPIGN